MSNLPKPEICHIGQVTITKCQRCNGKGVITSNDGTVQQGRCLVCFGSGRVRMEEEKVKAPTVQEIAEIRDDLKNRPHLVREVQLVKWLLATIDERDHDIFIMMKDSDAYQRGIEEGVCKGRSQMLEAINAHESTEIPYHDEYWQERVEERFGNSVCTILPPQAMRQYIDRLRKALIILSEYSSHEEVSFAQDVHNMRSIAKEALNMKDPP